MAFSRYDGRTTFINDDENYHDAFFIERGVAQIDQYRTAAFYYPTNEELDDLELTPHIWKSNSRLYKLADDAYGSPEYWWVIAWINKKPTEGHFKVGEIIYIPAPLIRVLSIFQRQKS